jgi:hypothetical protein
VVRVAAVLLALALAGCTQAEPPDRRTQRTVPAFILAQVLPARQVFGSCLASRVGQKSILTDVEYLRCGLATRSGYRSRGTVVGATPGLVDTVGEPPFGKYCPQETDEVVSAEVPSGQRVLICLDSKLGHGNPGGLGERAFDRFK